MILVRRLAVAAVALIGMAACSAKVDDRRPLPTTSASGELVCGFVSQESVSVALGTTDFTPTGTKVDAGTNPDGSSLAQAVCDLYSDDVKGDRALIVAVQPLGYAAKADAIVPRELAAGGAQYVFPASDGEGFATSNQVLYSGAGVSHLIRGDWHYTVAIQKAAKGRNAVDDAVAITRQVVATLNLPEVGTKPRPTVSPAKWLGFTRVSSAGGFRVECGGEGLRAARQGGSALRKA